MHDVAILYYVVFPFYGHAAGGADGSFGAVVDKVFVLNYFRPDEATFEVCVDYAGGAGGFVPFADGPGAAFVGPGCEEGPEAQ